MKQGMANLAEDYCFIHKALWPVGTARRQIAAVPPSNLRPALGIEAIMVSSQLYCLLIKLLLCQKLCLILRVQKIAR